MSRRRNRNRNKKNNNTQVVTGEQVSSEVVAENASDITSEAIENTVDDTLVAESVVDNLDANEVFEEPLDNALVEEEPAHADVDEHQDVFEETLDVNAAEEYYDEDLEYFDATPDEYEEVGEEYGGFAEKYEANSHEYDDLEQKHSQEGFKDFFREFSHHTGKRVKKHSRLIGYGLGFVALIIVVIVVTFVISNRTKDKKVDTQVSGNVVVSDVPVEELQKDAFAEVNAIINTYYDAIANNNVEALNSIRDRVDSIELARAEVKSKYIDSYSNIECYTKSGPFENSYIVYAKYLLKVSEYDILAPGISTFLVCTRDDGSLYLYSEDYDETIANYIKEVTATEDVAELFKAVDIEYKNILAGNQEYADYMSALKQMIRNDVASKLADSYVDSGESGNSVSDNTVKDPSVSDNDAKPTTFEVKALTTVNVRKSDSTDADALGKVTEGTVLTCNEQKVNGWSQIVYEGQIGYVKSEFLEKVSEGDNGHNTALTTGNITVSQTVNIRKSPSTNSDSLGVAYSGESLPLVEHMNNGWTKVVYKDKEAYVKTEYVNK